MGRPERHDVDYFPFFAKRGKTLNILQSKFGLEGIGFFTNLLRFLALTPDHYYCIKEDEDKLNFFAETGVQEESKGLDMLDMMVKTGKLDKGLWENHRVMASGAFLESLKEAYKRRSNDILTIEEITAKFEKGHNNPVYVDNNSVNADILPTETELLSKKNNNNPQSKVKKSKVKKSKEELSSEMKDALLLSELLLTSHRKEIPDYLSGKDDQKTIYSWAVDIEKIIRLDKKTPDVIRQVIVWAKIPGCFWFPNIQSGSKLRKQFETLYSQMIAECKRKGKSAQPHKINADNISDEKLDEYFN